MPLKTLEAVSEQVLHIHKLLVDRPRAISRVPLLINANRLQTVYLKIRPDMRSGQGGRTMFLTSNREPYPLHAMPCW